MGTQLEFSRREPGMYDVYLFEDGTAPVRIGIVSGGRKSWHAEAANGHSLTPLRNCETRKDAGDRLLIYHKTR